MNPAIFLDRDGVLIENRSDYVRSWKQAVVYAGAVEALAAASRSGYKVVMVTNQSGVGRGLMPVEAAEDINRRLVLEVHKAGGRIDVVCMCVHAPEQRCQCRKPKPGMLLRAAQMLDIDLQRSIMIGDALTDVEAGRAAGVGRLALVLTGLGAEQAPELQANGDGAPSIYEDLAAALRDLA